MAEEIELLMVLAVLGFVVFLVYLYLASIQKVLRVVGFTPGEASTIVFVTLFLGWISVPILPYGGWWIGMSLGGAIIPLALCAYLLKLGRFSFVDATIGVIIVSYVSYFVTRPEEGIGIVADLPLAFAPALAAGLYSLSTFWGDISRAGPLAYVSGVLGTIVGADLFHLPEVLSFEPPSEGFPMLSIGGANIFDMVYLSGIVAVAVASVVLWVKRQEERHGFGAIVTELERQTKEAPYAKDLQPAPPYDFKQRYPQRVRESDQLFPPERGAP